MAESRHGLPDKFHALYYTRSRRTWESTRWFGHRMLKCPFDLWMYQELIFELRPDLIIETGTFEGASAFYFATILDLIGSGEIVTIDIDERPDRPTHASPTSRAHRLMTAS